ncbi:helix-turn-helix domain-containing protein [Bacillus wiedmannii]|uniref:helix-turn-helix domain-containing protein n=1 Tax=Bacillus wiedmannii TaxID=1890302 RepID=UPI0021D0B2FF|nr:helix-turn-helix transcriptional regulator [Bacillus wiedmannii]MCU5681279.1 helix-turn-helix domain-containing protein [Bacillus wiedmannii]
MRENRIRELRKERGLTLRELAEELNIPFTTLGNYERGDRHPDFDTLEKIASYFDVMIDYLLKRTDIRTFDELVFKNDFSELEELLSKVKPEIRKPAVDIIDAVYLTVRENVLDEDTEKLKKMHQLIWDLKSLERDLFLYRVDSGKNHISDFSVYEMMTIYTEFKTKINIHLDDLFKDFIKKWENK